MSSIAAEFERGVRATIVAAVLCALAALAGCASHTKHGDADLPNFQQVNAGLYRGGQPTAAGFQRLQQLGVRTILNVRGGDTDRDLVNGLAFDYRARPMSAWRGIDDDDVIWFLKIATDPARGPVFLHCHRGSDRTGCLVAMYRVAVEGWDRERAIAEMTADGNGFHDIYQGLITYVRQADVERLRREAGLAAPAPVADAR